MDDIVFRLKERARIRRQIPSRKSVQEGKPDRISDLLEEAALEIETLRREIIRRDNNQTSENPYTWFDRVSNQ